MLLGLLQAGVMVCGLLVGTQTERCSRCLPPEQEQAKMQRAQAVQEGKMEQLTIKSCELGKFVPKQSIAPKQ